MQENPYQSNTTSPSLASDTTSVQFREFTGKTFSVRFSQKQIRNEIRASAQLAIELPPLSINIRSKSISLTRSLRHPVCRVAAMLASRDRLRHEHVLSNTVLFLGYRGLCSAEFGSCEFGSVSVRSVKGIIRVKWL
jgi:hypothetical protein